MARQARSLDILLAEVNAAHGDRSKVSDGGLGDPAHASRASDHNANEAGVWRARDFTDDRVDDNRDGDDDDMLDCDKLAARLVAMYHQVPVHPAMGSGAYTIWESRIYSYDRRREGWRPYSGPNPHDKHLHQSVATAASGYDSTAPWGVMEDDMSWNENIPRWYPGDTDASDELSAADHLKQARGFAQEAYRAARRADIRSERLEAAMTALAAGLGATVEAAVREALADAVVDVDVNVTGGSGA